MQDPVRHVVVDACVLGACLCPQSADSQKLRERSATLLESVLIAHWPSIRLYTPAICVAEARAVLDKYRFCTWHGPLKTKPARKMRSADYRAAQDRLTEAVKARCIEQLEQEPAHVLVAGLVSPVNNCFQVRRRRPKGKGNDTQGKRTAEARRVRAPMGAADCLIAGMAILLGQRVGTDRVVLVTAEQRMGDVMAKCRKLTQPRAITLGLVDAARNAGIAWDSGVYVKCLNLREAREEDLRSAFLGWPLPVGNVLVKSRRGLTAAENRLLGQVWLELSESYDITNPDRLPYTRAIDDLRTRFAVSSGIHLANKDIFRALVSWRKGKRWPFDTQRHKVGHDKMPLFDAC